MNSAVQGILNNIKFLDLINDYHSRSHILAEIWLSFLEQVRRQNGIVGVGAEWLQPFDGIIKLVVAKGHGVVAEHVAEADDWRKSIYSHISV